jgi:2-iminobutanoate/2-iminopropanoate deaminase
MSKEKIEVEGAKVYGPYSSGIKAGGMIYLAGQIAPEAGDDIASQTGAVLGKIDALLAAAGTDRHSLVFAQVLLAEIDDFAAMNEVYGTWLADCENPPARAAFGGNDLPGGALVEIVAQAVAENCC